MKTKITAILMVMVMVLSMTAYAGTEPSDFAVGRFSENFPRLYSTVGAELDYQAPIDRAMFSALVVDAFRTLNNGVFPQLRAENPFIDLGEKQEDIFVIMLYGMRVVTGVSATEFAPRRALTNQEMVTILVRAKIRQNPELISEISSAAGCLDGFEDAGLIAPWAKESFEYAYKTGIVSDKDGKLAPLDTVTTEEAMIACTNFQTK